MNDPPAQPARRSPGTYPRRRPANKSVSLLHSPKSPRSSQGPRSSEDETLGSSMLADRTTTTPVRPTYHKNSSGESSNTERWFERSNNNVKTGDNDFADDEPPFFLRNSSDETTPLENVRQRVLDLQPQSMGLSSRNQHVHSEGRSSTAEFRSVIDDLTVQNKKLKRLLRKYEKLHNSQLHEDKLFEVRVHGLAADKKRELEDVLRNFVIKLDDAPEKHKPGVNYRPSTLHKDRMGSSNTSTRFEDSAYASLSTSGQHSSGWSLQGPLGRKGLHPSAMSKEQKQDIHSYLHDIPTGLLPKTSVPMSERSKKKLVVQRLEHIFAGKDPSAGYHQQPEQQQKVSQSAARADRKAIEASGRRAQEEGSREAPIMLKGDDSSSQGTEVPVPPRDEVVMKLGDGTDQLESDDVLEQRPTRPLDLDPYRAQVPAENIKYIRHLGFSPPDAESTAVQADGHGWIYLNVLTNMAQLHTINVTPEFIRKAIYGYSKYLELSADGRKVRWRGGTDVTHLSSSNSPDYTNSLDKPPQLKHTGDSNSKSTQMNIEGGMSETQQHGHKREKLNKRHKLTYSPLFFHEVGSEMDESGVHDDLTNWSSNIAGNSPRLTGSGPKTNAARQPRTDDGPIIFYNKVGFYTDLSGDPGRRDMNKSNYTRSRGDPIGAETSAQSDSLRILQAGKGPLSRQNMDQYPEAPFRPVASESDLKVIRFLQSSLQHGSSPSETTEPMELEASGIGGVVPADNFCINVRIRQSAEVSSSSAATLPATRRSKPAYPLHIRNALQRTISKDRVSSGQAKPSRTTLVQREIIGSKVRNLPASSLPPPSYYQFSSPDEDSDSDQDENDSDFSFDSTKAPLGLSIAAHADKEPLASSVVQRMEWNAMGNCDSTSSPSAPRSTDSDDDGHASIASYHGSHDDGPDEHASNAAVAAADSDGGTVDLLATARHVNVATVHFRERKLESETANRLAEEMPAGSSAAMAKGGSGFNSPALARDRISPGAENERTRASIVKRASLKRNRRSDDSVEMRQRTTKSPKRGKRESSATSSENS